MVIRRIHIDSPQRVERTTYHKPKSNFSKCAHFVFSTSFFLSKSLAFFIKNEYIRNVSIFADWNAVLNDSMNELHDVLWSILKIYYKLQLLLK
jgi:hypothetical protein